MKKKKSTGTILAALFAALISAGCFIQIPLPGGIPIILQDMLAMLSGMLLGPLYGSIAVFVFLVLGSIGLPVFSGKAGLQVITAGPTGGFLIGYLLGALAAGLFLKFLLPPASAERRHVKAKTYILITAAAVLATVIVFVCGIIGFMRVTGSDFSKTLAAVLIPFIPGNLLKIVLMVPLTRTFRPVIEQYTAA
ncbi:biotin transporter BioY [Treponema porcinum]|uniref:biotin transporter BioY n=1 Tax=Treponema porcinum TaxID=261392 RepID=UPI002A7FC4C2|nr:biotin transporter BioY [Treponema porcinum]MDY4190043.1 biotin transporter BioY [Treponema porcinum]